ncbi:hypothetical protein [Vreelandella titanicae]|uniref:hypothetical protein n=1 Tax=Vreelandella titanicae TaxID=664683 RepID=UPI003D2CB36E
MKKMKVSHDVFLPIIRDGAIASGDTADGRNIPILILDCAQNKNVLTLIQLHENSPPGDVISTWGVNKDCACLMLEFERPVAVKFGIKFDLETQGGLADGIVQSCGLYLQAGKAGDTIASNFDDIKLLIEVSPKTKIPDWDDKLEIAIARRMKRDGLSRKEAKKASKQFVERMREIWGLRMKV